MYFIPYRGIAKPLGGAVILAMAILITIVLSIVTGVFPPRSPSCNASPSSVATVNILNGSTLNSNGSITYSPKILTLVLGVNDTVVWKNQDTNDHTVSSTSSAPQQFDSGDIFPGGTYCFHFTKVGTYDYFCRFHSWMQGTLIVKTNL